jgi:hypothetical protein
MIAVAGTLVLRGIGPGFVPFVNEPATRSGTATSGSELFTHGRIPRLDLFLDPEQGDRLRQDSRQNVPARVVEDGQRMYRRVRLHLKGSTGSFRGLDDKPSFTLRFDGADAEPGFHGLRKLHLNNSVEDPSYFNEYAGSALFRAAQIPAPRVTHALVTLNGRRLGLYVLKEGFTEEFLGRYFQNPRGNLYDTGPGHDVDEALEKDAGVGPDDGSDLAALAAAAREPDVAARWVRLSRVLDLDRFAGFMAAEVVTGHRDGYCLARNNFRIYHDVDTGRMVFLPHGMDQLFGRPDATIRPALQGLVARAVLETPEGRQAYGARVAAFTTNLLDVARLHREADDLVQRVRPFLPGRELRALETAIADSKERIALRRASLERQLNEPERRPPEFVRGRFRLVEWQGFDAPAGGSLERRPAPRRGEALHIRAGPMTSASWRTTVRLGPGRYKFRGQVVTEGVRPLPFGRNHGAGLRVVGASAIPPYELLGDHAGALLEQPFEVEGERDIELICELRARAGAVWFLMASLELESLASP